MATFVGTLAAGAAASGGTAGAATTAGSVLSAPSVIAGGLTAFTALTSLSAGVSQMQASRAAAEEQDRVAENARIQGIQRANEIRENYLKTVASQNVAYASSGIDLGSGSVEAVQRETAAIKDRQLSVNRFDTGQKVAAAGTRRRQLLAEGDAALTAGAGRAAGAIAANLA